MFACWETDALKESLARHVAIVFSVRGNVVFGNAERNDFQPVTPKSRIQAGDVVRTSEGASINLALTAGAFVQLAGNSEIKIENLSINEGRQRHRRTHA